VQHLGFSRQGSLSIRSDDAEVVPAPFRGLDPSCAESTRHARTTGPAPGSWGSPEGNTGGLVWRPKEISGRVRAPARPRGGRDSPAMGSGRCASGHGTTEEDGGAPCVRQRRVLVLAVVRDQSGFTAPCQAPFLRSASTRVKRGPAGPVAGACPTKRGMKQYSRSGNSGIRP